MAGAAKNPSHKNLLSKPSLNPKPTSATPTPDPGQVPIPSPSYGFHMLERRSIVLADGSTRSYFALPPDYHDHPPPYRYNADSRFPLKETMSPEMGDPYLRGRGKEQVNPMGKMKFGGESELDRKRRNLLQFGEVGSDPNGDFGKRREMAGLGGDDRELDSQRRNLLQFGKAGNDRNGYPEGCFSERREMTGLGGNEGELGRKRRHLLQFGDLGNDPNGYPGGEFNKRREMVGLGGNGRELDRQRRNLLQFGNTGNDPKGYGDYLAGPSNSREMAGLSEVDEFRMVKQMRLGGGFQGSQVHTGLGKHSEVDQSALKKAFLHYVRSINENNNQIKFYLENGKQSTLHCMVCNRSARNFPDMHALIMHTYNPDGDDKLVDHLGFHKALCVLMGWSYSISPDNSRAYQSLSADEAAANKDDVILWPPMVVVHNTITGKGKKGMEGLGNKAMDDKMRELGFASGKARSIYGREGHTGITLVKFSGDQSGLKEAVRLAEFLEGEKRGRKPWAHVQSSSTMGKEDEKNPNLMELDKKTGEKQRILYGYLGTVFDLDKVDFDTRKKICIEIKRDYGSTM